MTDILNWLYENIERFALVGARWMIVFYGTFAVGYFLKVLRRPGNYVPRPIMYFTIWWHLVLTGMAAWLIIVSADNTREFFRATYGAAFVGALSGLLWIIVEGRRYRRLDRMRETEIKTEKIFTDVVDQAVTQVSPDQYQEGA